HFPIATFKIGDKIKPMAVPSAMLYAKGINATISSAGNLSHMSFISVLRLFRTIKPPTVIRIGALPPSGISLLAGMQKTDTINIIPAVTDVKPVRPPAAIAAVLSALATVGLVPKMPDAIDDKEVAWNARPNCSGRFTNDTCP